MELRFLGHETMSGGSPTLYATDRETYIVQGYRVSDPEILTRLDQSENQPCVVIYARLLAHLAKDGLSGVVTKVVPPIVHVTEEGNYVVRGRRLIDGEARSQMQIPDGEEAIEVSRADMQTLFEEDSRESSHQ